MFEPYSRGDLTALVKTRYVTPIFQVYQVGKRQSSPLYKRGNFINYKTCWRNATFKITGYLISRIPHLQEQV